MEKSCPSSPSMDTVLEQYVNLRGENLTGGGASGAVASTPLTDTQKARLCSSHGQEGD